MDSTSAGRSFLICSSTVSKPSIQRGDMNVWEKYRTRGKKWAT